MAETRQPRVNQIASQAIHIYRHLHDHPLTEIDELIGLLRITRTELYKQLWGLRDDPQICRRGRFQVLDNGRRLRRDEVESYLDEREPRKSGPPPLERILYLYHQLFMSTGSGGMDMEEIKAMYNDLIADYGLSSSEAALRRMIFRDLRLLEEMGIALQRPSSSQPRYALMNLFLPRLKREEAMMMYLSTLLFPDTLMDESASCVRRQMEKASLHRMTAEARILKERVCVIGDALVNPDAFGGCLEQIITGLINNQVVDFEYVKQDGSFSRRILAPLGLVCKRGIWYLIAGKRNGQRRRTFRVDQIRRISARPESFAYPPDFQLSAYLGASWGIMNEGAAEKVLIKFAPHVASRLEIMRYHPSQRIEGQTEDGSLLVSYETSGFTELKGWLMQWGTAAEVLEPVSLRDLIGAEAAEMAALYGMQK